MNRMQCAREIQRSMKFVDLHLRPRQIFFQRFARFPEMIGKNQMLASITSVQMMEPSAKATVGKPILATARENRNPVAFFMSPDF